MTAPVSPTPPHNATPPGPPDFGLDQGEQSRGDPERLHQLLVDLEKILGSLVEFPRPLIPGRHHERLDAAWKNSAGVRQALREWVLDRNYQAHLAAAGLRGRQLDYKVELFNHARDNVLDHGLPGIASGRLPSWYRRLFDLLRPVLKVGGLVVGSLVNASGFAEAFKELIEAIEAGMDLSEIALDALSDGTAV